MNNFVIVAVILCAFSITSYAQDLSIPDLEAHDFDSITHRAAALEIQRGLAPIKSQQDLAIHIAAHWKDQASPLHKLSEQSFADFIDRLVFTSNGLASYDSQPLVDELSSAEIYDVLQLFGVQYDSPLLDTDDLSTTDKFVQSIACDGITDCLDDGDRKGWACLNPGTCVATFDNFICTSNC